MSVLDRLTASVARKLVTTAVLSGAVALGPLLGACGGIGINGTDEGSTFFDSDSGTSAAPVSGNASAAADAGVTSSGEAGATLGSVGIPTASSVCGDTSRCAPDQATASGCTAETPDATDGSVEAADAGAVPGTGSDGGGSACRVRNVSATGTSGTSGSGSSSSLTSICTSAGTGIDGAACSSGGDCAAGFDCVGTPGVCRAYCCGGTCTAGASFCDVQPTAGQSSSSGTTVADIPVCVPIATCKLLMPNACATGSTCGVVDDNGTTSCLTVGAAVEGDSCDSVHCADDMVCLGQSGSRRCERLCTIDGSDCATGQTCTGNAQVFTDTTIGVCQ